LNAPHTVAMTIAGSDPSGGAGLQADIKTFHQHGVYATSVVTLLTVQNTQSVSAVEMLRHDFVLAQLDAVLGDLSPRCAKTGALGSATMIAAIAQRAANFDFPLVVDPVMISKHGHRLIDDSAVTVLSERLLPVAFLVTPNRREAERLTGLAIRSRQDMIRAAQGIAGRGVPNVLIKGGQDDGQSIDLLWNDGDPHWLVGPWIDTKSLHGSGCVFSAAITARLARGETLLTAAENAKRFITEAIRTAPKLGHGFGPVNMTHDTPTFQTQP
jgi:hydroxymethylpyrimidine/phosphomethylpyrimidine kinase